MFCSVSRWWRFKSSRGLPSRSGALPLAGDKRAANICEPQLSYGYQAMYLRGRSCCRILVGDGWDVPKLRIEGLLANPWHGEILMFAIGYPEEEAWPPFQLHFPFTPEQFLWVTRKTTCPAKDAACLRHGCGLFGQVQNLRSFARPVVFVRSGKSSSQSESAGSDLLVSQNWSFCSHGRRWVNRRTLQNLSPEVRHKQGIPNTNAKSTWATGNRTRPKALKRNSTAQKLGLSKPGRSKYVLS